MNVRLHIEELVLHGFKPGDRHEIAGAVEAELARLFAEQGIPTHLDNGANVARLDAGSFKVQQGAKPNQVGAQVAHAVHRGLTK